MDSSGLNDNGLPPSGNRSNGLNSPQPQFTDGLIDNPSRESAPAPEEISRGTGLHQTRKLGDQLTNDLAVPGTHQPYDAVMQEPQVYTFPESRIAQLGFNPNIVFPRLPATLSVRPRHVGVRYPSNVYTNTSQAGMQAQREQTVPSNSHSGMAGVMPQPTGTYGNSSFVNGCSHRLGPMPQGYPRQGQIGMTRLPSQGGQYSTTPQPTAAYRNDPYVKEPMEDVQYSNTPQPTGAYKSHPYTENGSWRVGPMSPANTSEGQMRMVTPFMQEVQYSSTPQPTGAYGHNLYAEDGGYRARGLNADQPGLSKQVSYYP